MIFLFVCCSDAQRLSVVSFAFPIGRFIAAGGSGSNEAKVFDHANDDALVGMVAGLPRGVFTLDWCPSMPSLAVAGGDAPIRIFDIVPA